MCPPKNTLNLELVSLLIIVAWQLADAARVSQHAVENSDQPCKEEEADSNYKESRQR